MSWLLMAIVTSTGGPNAAGSWLNLYNQIYLEDRKMSPRAKSASAGFCGNSCLVPCTRIHKPAAPKTRSKPSKPSDKSLEGSRSWPKVETTRSLLGSYDTANMTWRGIVEETMDPRDG